MDSMKPDTDSRKSGWINVLLAPLQFVVGFAISLGLIAGVGYASTWMTEGRCALCTAGQDEVSAAKPENETVTQEESETATESAPAPEQEMDKSGNPSEPFMISGEPATDESGSEETSPEDK